MSSPLPWALEKAVGVQRIGPVGSQGQDAPGCSSCYAYGVICALLGASLQAVGLQIWKLHYLRVEQAEKEEVALIAQSISEEASRRQDLVETKVEMPSGPNDEAEHMADLDLLDLAVIPDQHGTVGYAADIKNSATFLQVIRHVRNHSNHSIHSSTSQASGDAAAGVGLSFILHSASLVCAMGCVAKVANVHEMCMSAGEVHKSSAGAGVDELAADWFEPCISAAPSNHLRIRHTIGRAQRHSSRPVSQGAGCPHLQNSAEDIQQTAELHAFSAHDAAADVASLPGARAVQDCSALDDAKKLDFESSRKEEFAHKAYMPSCLWTAGFSVFLVGNVLDFIALGLTKVSIVTLVGSGSLVVNTVMARLLLKEIVTMLDILSAGCIILGISLTVIGNQSEVKEWPVEELVKQYSRADVVAMLVVFTGLIVACLLIMAIDTTRRRAVAARTGLEPRPSRWIGAITCIVGAFVATFTILFGKAFSNLILLTIAGDNQFTDVVTVLIVLAFMVSLPSQLVLINMSLAINDALMHIPNFYVFWNLGSIVSGAIFYHELEQLSAWHMVVFFLGVAILIFAVTMTNISGARKQRALEAGFAQDASLHSLQSHRCELGVGDARSVEGTHVPAGGRGRLWSGAGVLPPPSIPSPETSVSTPNQGHSRSSVSPAVTTDGSVLPPSIPFPSPGTSFAIGAAGAGKGSSSHAFHGVYISASASLGGFDGLKRGRSSSYTCQIPVGATLGTPQSLEAQGRHLVTGAGREEQARGLAAAGSVSPASSHFVELVDECGVRGHK